jgi:HSP20 family protein
VTREPDHGVPPTAAGPGSRGLQLLRRQTRTVGRFRYEVGLPDQVDGEGIDASLKEGVLHLRVPKTQGTQRRRIEVK